MAANNKKTTVTAVMGAMVPLMAAAAVGAVAAAPGVRRRRSGHARRRRRYRRRTSKPVKMRLPVGLRVYCAVMVESPEPDQLPRRKWEWCRIVGRDPHGRGFLVRRETAGDDIAAEQMKRVSELHIKPVSARNGKRHFRWLKLAAAAVRASTFWWFKGYESQRLATELEVHAYQDGLVPHDEWRLFDSDSNLAFADDISEPLTTTHLFVDEPKEKLTADEKRLKRREADTKRSLKKEAAARKMLGFWQRAEVRAAKKAAAYRKKVAYYERKKEKS
jgi:hypothetical protein